MNRYQNQDEVLLRENTDKQQKADRKRTKVRSSERDRGESQLAASIQTGPEKDEYSIRFNLRESRELTKDQKNTILQALIDAPERDKERRHRPQQTRSRENTVYQHENREQEQKQESGTDGKKPILQVLADNPGIVPIYGSGVFSGITLALFFGMYVI